MESIVQNLPAVFWGRRTIFIHLRAPRRGVGGTLAFRFGRGGDARSDPPGEQDRGRFYPQNPRSQRDYLPPGSDRLGHLTIAEASLGTDGYMHRLRWIDHNFTQGNRLRIGMGQPSVAVPVATLSQIVCPFGQCRDFHQQTTTTLLTRLDDGSLEPIEFRFSRLHYRLSCPQGNEPTNPQFGEFLDDELPPIAFGQSRRDLQLDRQFPISPLLGNDAEDHLTFVHVDDFGLIFSTIAVE